MSAAAAPITSTTAIRDTLVGLFAAILLIGVEVVWIGCLGWGGLTLLHRTGLIATSPPRTSEHLSSQVHGSLHFLTHSPKVPPESRQNSKL